MNYDHNCREHQLKLRDVLWCLWVDMSKDDGKKLARELSPQLAGADLESLELTVRDVMASVTPCIPFLRKWETEGPNTATAPWNNVPKKWSPEDDKPQSNAWTIFLYGDTGVGKSTWASLAPKPFFFDLENGLKYIKCKKTKLITNVSDFDRALDWFWTSEYKTGVIDTASKLENMMGKEILSHNSGMKTLASDFGKGFALLKGQFQELIDRIQRNCSTYDKNVIIIGHCTVGDAPNPDGEEYKRYIPDMHKSVTNYVSSQVDACLLAYLDVFVRETESEDYIAKLRDKEPKLLCGFSPIAICKNRFNLPNGIKMDKAVFDAIEAQSKRI